MALDRTARPSKNGLTSDKQRYDRQNSCQVPARSWAGGVSVGQSCARTSPHQRSGNGGPSEAAAQLRRRRGKCDRNLRSRAQDVASTRKRSAAARAVRPYASHRPSHLIIIFPLRTDVISLETSFLAAQSFQEAADDSPSCRATCCLDCLCFIPPILPCPYELTGCEVACGSPKISASEIDVRLEWYT